jgi:hypothetical protein
MAVGTAVVGLATLSTAVAPALITVAVGTVFGAMGVLATSAGLGFLSAAGHKLGLTAPEKAVRSVARAGVSAGHQIGAAGLP